MRTLIACGAALVLTGCGTSSPSPAGQGVAAEPAAAPTNGVDSYESDHAARTADERAGRDTWHFWTAGNATFWRRLAARTSGAVDLLTYADSRRHDRRFELLGVINEPKCRAATAPDRYGLWLDDCSAAEQIARMPGRPIGIVGLRRFDNPLFDAARWSVDAYVTDRASIEPPYLVGMACAFCHVGFNPINPPEDPNRAAWSNLSPTVGNQYFEEGKLFSLTMTPADFRWQMANRQPAGTSDTSRLATDHINNPSAINGIFGLAYRPTAAEKMPDGSTRQVPHILKDGADSIGVAGAALRVYLNIGMCGEYTDTLNDPIDGVRQAQRPFDPERARRTCEAWRNTEARMPALEAFLRTRTPLRLADAPGGRAYLASDREVLRRGKLAFAEACTPCHSSKQPPAGVTDARRWFRDSVLRDDFLANNFLSDDERYPVSFIGTNVGRAMASNATRGHIWEPFSSETYKTLPAVGTLHGLYNPTDPGRPIDFTMPGGGRGFYRTPSLVGLWASAPYLHNNSVGVFIRNPSVSARMAAFTDGIEKLLWPDRRPGIRAIPVTTADSRMAIAGTTRTLRIPKGTPIDYIARADPLALERLATAQLDDLTLKLTAGDVLLSALLSDNLAPDFVLDRGHTFGADLSDGDKRALVEFLKTF